jgi:hypothetical protein
VREACKRSSHVQRGSQAELHRIPLSFPLKIYSFPLFLKKNNQFSYRTAKFNQWHRESRTATWGGRIYFPTPDTQKAKLIRKRMTR